jgi:hypothetical protein
VSFSILLSILNRVVFGIFSQNILFVFPNIFRKNIFFVSNNNLFNLLRLSNDGCTNAPCAEGIAPSLL